MLRRTGVAPTAIAVLPPLQRRRRRAVGHPVDCRHPTALIIKAKNHVDANRGSHDRGRVLP
jgi:hypothetical protein